MTKYFQALAIKFILSCVVFCIVLVSVFAGWVYVQSQRDEKLIRDFAMQRLNLTVERAELVTTHCSGQPTPIGKCSALLIKSNKEQCAHLISELRDRALNDCTTAFGDYKNHVFSIRPVGYSEKPGYFMEIVLMEQHFFNNAL